MKRETKDKKAICISFLIMAYLIMPFISFTQWKWKKDDDCKKKFSSIQYTDLTGFENDKPNGLLQQEFNFFLPVVTNAYSNGDGSVMATVFRNAEIDILLNRMDKSKTELNYPVGSALSIKNSNPTTTPYLTTMDIWKYSNLQTGFKLSLVSLKMNKTLVQFQYGFSLLKNKPYYGDTINVGVDSGKLSSDLRPVYSFVNKFEFNVQSTLTSADDFGVAFTAGLQFIDLKDSYYKQFDAAVVDPFNKITALLPANDALNGRKASPLYYTSLVLEKKWGTDNDNTAFFRTNYYYQTGNYNKPIPGNTVNGIPSFEAAKFYNHYVQLQLGISLGLEKLFGINLNGGATTQKAKVNTSLF